MTCDRCSSQGEASFPTNQFGALGFETLCGACADIAVFSGALRPIDRAAPHLLQAATRMVNTVAECDSHPAFGDILNELRRAVMRGNPA
jgi:hypothetical protein